MARTSRKNLHIDNEASASAIEVNKDKLKKELKKEPFRTAIYARISVETEEKRERGSMDNQVEFLKNYVELQEDLILVDTYIDDDVSGTNFERPAFAKLIEAVKKGRINCIVVKDLSRFGRNYVETGEFIEKIFPFLKVRFIAINDRFDSFSDHHDMVLPLKNIVNEIYAKDISKKIGTSVLTRQKKGEYIGGRTVYGYLKDPKDKHKLIVDPNTAPIVKRIFEWKLSGLSYLAIARKLNGEGILSPTQYKYSIGILHDKANEQHLWNAVNIKRILSNPIYLGNMVQGKERQAFYKNQGKTKVSEEQWIIVPNTHEAIVNKETFESVKKQLELINTELKRNVTSVTKEKTINLFKGLIYCKQCGKKMYLHTSESSVSKQSASSYVYYRCITYREHLNPECADKRIKYDDLLKVVEKTLVEYSRLFEDKSNKLSINENQGVESVEAVRKKACEKRLDKIKRFGITLYTDYVEGFLTKEEYSTMKGEYQKEFTFLEKELKVLEKQIQSNMKKQVEFTKARKTMEEYLKNNKITEEIIHQFIDRIEVSRKDQVKIQFKFDDFVDKVREQSDCCGEGETND